MNDIKYLTDHPLLIIPLVCFVVGMVLMVTARLHYQFRKKKIIAIITPSKISDEYSSFEKRLFFSGLILCVIGIILFAIL